MLHCHSPVQALSPSLRLQDARGSLTSFGCSSPHVLSAAQVLRLNDTTSRSSRPSLGLTLNLPTRVNVGTPRHLAKAIWHKQGVIDTPRDTPCTKPTHKPRRFPERQTDFAVADIRMEARSIRELVQDHSKTLEMADRLNRYGIAVIQLPKDCPLEEMHLLGDLFGREVPYPKMRSNGMLLIDPNDPNTANVANTEVEHPLHTDEAYSPNPGKILCLMPEVAAEEGGENVIVSGQKLYEIMQKNKKLYEGCFVPDSLTVGRTPIGETVEQKCSFPIFQHNKTDSNITLRFRSNDFAIKNVNPDSRPSWETLCKLTEEKTGQNQRMVVKLHERELLILDNTAMLHGRMPYARDSGRRLWRVNFFGDQASKSHLFNLGVQSGTNAHHGDANVAGSENEPTSPDQ